MTFVSFSAERGGGESADAVEHRRRRHTGTGSRRQHEQLLHAGNVQLDRSGEGAVVVRQPARALHGPAGPARLREALLR